MLAQYHLDYYPHWKELKNGRCVQDEDGNERVRSNVNSYVRPYYVEHTNTYSSIQVKYQHSYQRVVEENRLLFNQNKLLIYKFVI